MQVFYLPDRFIQLNVTYHLTFQEPTKVRITPSRWEVVEELDVSFFEASTGHLCYQLPGAVYGFFINDLLEKVVRMEQVA